MPNGEAKHMYLVEVGGITGWQVWGFHPSAEEAFDQGNALMGSRWRVVRYLRGSIVPKPDTKG